MPKQNIKRSLRLLAICLLVAFCAQVLLRAWFLDVSDNDPGLINDHFRNAVVAKNMVHGLGWSSSGYETYPLNPEVLTSGPTVILPVSLAIDIFGNKINTPGISMALVNIFLFLSTLILLRKYFNDDRLYVFIILSVVFFESTYPHYWSYAIGEVPSVLLLMISLLLLDLNNKKNLLIKIIASGLVAGMAILAKQIVFLSCLGITSGLFLHLVFSKKYELRRIFLILLLFVISWLIPTISFWIYKIKVLSNMDSVWVAAYHQYENKIFLIYSGASSFIKYFDQSIPVREHFLSIYFHEFDVASGFLSESFFRGYSVFFILSLAIITGIYAVFLFRKVPIAFLFYAGCIPIIMWFFFIADSSMPRYLYIGYSVLGITAIFCICMIDNYKLMAFLSLLFIAIIVLSISSVSRSAILSMPTKQSLLKDSIDEVEAYIRIPARKISWIGMRENAEFEYLSDRPNSFDNALFQVADAVEFDEEAYLKRYPLVGQLVNTKKYKSGYDYFTDPAVTERHVAPVHIVKEISFYWLHEKPGRPPVKTGVLCADIAFQNAYYLVEDCHTGDIAKYIAARGGIDFRTSHWLWPRAYPPEEGMLFF